MSERPASPSPRRRAWKRPVVLVPLGLLLASVFLVAMALFEPWTLFTDEVVDEALPGSAVATSGATPSPSDLSPEKSKPAGTDSTPTPAPDPGPETLAAGSFISHEHGTTGEVRVLELEDGSRVLRIDGLDTSNGPDLRVWITDAPVIEGRNGWFVFDDGQYVDLGALKGNQGNQNYALPESVDLDELTSVSIWCQRFRVSFGAAELS